MGIVVVIILLFTVGKKNAAIDRAISGLFPAGERVITPAAPGEEGRILPEGEGIARPEEKPVFTQIAGAISGAAFRDGKVRYIEKATGHVYEIGPQGENLIRISNTTIPRIFDVIWSKDKDRAILKYLQDGGLRIFSARFIASSTQGVFLSPAITTITASPDEDRIFYMLPAGTTYTGLTASFEDTNKKQVVSLPFGEFSASWVQKNSLTLATKPSYLAAGFLYALDASSGNLRKITGDLPGLQALWSPANDKVLISYSGSAENINLSVMDAQKKTFSPLAVKTLAEKCVWSKKEKSAIYCAVPVLFPKASLPDDWFQGLVSFEDNFIKINLDTNEMTSVFGEMVFYSIDAVKPFLSDDESFLFFINKSDNTLWSLKISN